MLEMSVICIFIFSFLIYTLMFYKQGIKIDEKNKRLSSMMVQQKKHIDDNLNKSFYKRFISPVFSSVYKYILKLAPKNNQSSKSSANIRLAKDLKMGGIALTASEFSSIKLFATISILGLSLFIAVVIPEKTLSVYLIPVMGVMLAILIPRYYLKMKITNRQKSIENQLPDVLDILCVSIEAGLGFDAALLKIGEYMQGPIVDELMITQREIQMGKPRRDALKNLSERSYVEELKTFTSSVIQADQFGISIKKVLAVQSAHLREVRRQKAQEKGMKAPIKIMIPMVIFIFPVIFIILLGPTVIEMIGKF